uniref:Uncharacterized protein n=1 Tax=Cannabis sativa TaxID=3483 RepID=A0A803NJC1_CANSA
MASSSTVPTDLEDSYLKIQLEEEEEGVLLCDLVEDVGQPIDVRWCLVGKFLTSRLIDFLSMQHTMASLWQPGKAQPQRKNKLIGERWLRTGTTADSQLFDGGENAINVPVITPTRNQGLKEKTIVVGADFVMDCMDQGIGLNKESAFDQGIDVLNAHNVIIEDNFQSESMTVVDSKRRRT